MVDEAAPRQSRSEELRENYHSHRGWIKGNGIQVSKDPAKLVEEIAGLESELKRNEKAEQDAYLEFTEARRSYDAAKEQTRKIKDMLDVHKLALSDAVQIPR